MSSDDEGPVAWLRSAIESDLALARRVLARWVVPADHPTRPEGEPVWPAPSVEALMVFRGEDPDVNAGLDLIRLCSPAAVVADCEAKLAIIDRCETLLPPDPADLDEHYQDGRDDDERMRDEALADLADDVLALVADGYRHRPGWAEHWACPGCGKALSEVPADHCLTRVTPLDLDPEVISELEPGPWTCRDIKPLSPEEFIQGGRETSERPPGSSPAGAD